MPISKHARAQRRLRGTTYKLVRRGYLERKAEEQQQQQKHHADDGDASDGGVADGVQENEWIPQEEINKAYRNIRGRGAHGSAGEDGNPLLLQGHGSQPGDDADGYDLGEDADYWGEEGDDYYEDGEEDGEGEWIDDDAAFDEMFGDNDDDDGTDGDARESLLVRAKQQDRKTAAHLPTLAQQQQQQQHSKKSVKFNLDPTAAVAAAPSSSAASPLPASAMKQSTLNRHPNATSGTADYDELAEEQPPARHRAGRGSTKNDDDDDAIVKASTGKRGRRMESDDDDESDADTLEEEEGLDEAAFEFQYEEDEWENNRHSRKKKNSKGLTTAATTTTTPANRGDRNTVHRDREEEDDKLFEDEMECEVTDEFLRQLVFGTGPAARAGGSGDGDEDEDGDGDVDDDEEGGGGGDGIFDLANPPAGMDQEVWNLLTEEERQAVLETQQRGTKRRQQGRTRGSGADRAKAALRDAFTRDEHSLLDDEEGVHYPQHEEKDRRALENQFDAMMAEFEADMPINDFFAQDAEGNSTGTEYTDPRSLGALSIDKYFSALEEFVERRAGVDLETNEPRKNKGLLTQLKFLAHNAGAFDYNEKDHGVFLTNNVSDKQRKFVEEFRSETEAMKKAAKMRVLQRMLENRRRQEAGQPSLEEEEEKADIARAAANNGDFSFLYEDDNAPKYEIVEVKNRHREDRMDCETAASAYSSYYNQPNVIRAPGSRNKRGTRAAAASSSSSKQQQQQQQHMDELSEEDGRSEDGSSAQHPHAAAPEVSYVRDKNETKEEKKQRRQAVKQAQRERRQEKSNLKKTYKDVEKEETARAAVSQNAKRTIKFM